MSLNKFTNADYGVKKEWMSVNCKDITCETLTQTGGGGTLEMAGNFINTAVLGITKIINTTANSYTIISLQEGYNGQVIDIFTFPTGSEVVVIHNSGTGAPNEKVIMCQSNLDMDVRVDTPLGFTLGCAKLIYSTTLGYWVCFGVQPIQSF